MLYSSKYNVSFAKLIHLRLPSIHAVSLTNWYRTRFYIDLYPLLLTRSIVMSAEEDKYRWEKGYISASMPKTQLECVNTGMMVLTSVVFLTRTVTRFVQRESYELQDFFCSLAFISYVVMWVMYWKENDPLYRIASVQKGEIPPYPDLCKCCY